MRLPNWIIVLLNSTIGIALLTYLWYKEEGEVPVIWWDYAVLIVFFLIANTVGFAMKFASNGLGKFLPWKKYFGTRFLSEVFMRNAIIWLAIYIATVFRVGSLAWAEIWAFCLKYEALLLNLVVISLIITLFLSIATFTLFAYSEYSIMQIRSVELQRRQLQLQFEALRSQLSPHYLFNCLNTVSNLVYKDTQLAEEFIRRFAQTYQYVLSKNQEKLVSVAEEIDFVKSFHFLLQTRFGNGLQLQVKLSPDIMESKIPPLTLQILVENAVKHNVISQANPLSISIEESTNNTLFVRNNITQRPSHTTSLKVGLDNIKKRYAYFTQQAIDIHQNEDFSVQLPLLCPNEIKKGKYRMLTT